ncbi:unnamed protein product [Bemisia tabaci]|uniref:Dynein heavy chain linker domain-containing protein n=1 Tax=Bemisia tabaci TaxID=7038 RepID=A0A9P0A5S9_BEMTA|nr:unnamed protein product [Bemisia tabaci]
MLNRSPIAGEVSSWSCNYPYLEIDRIHLEIKDLEEMMCRLNEQANLFEVSCPDFKHVPIVRKELRLLKILWDYIIIIRSWFRDWEDTQWTRIDSEAMDMELKKFSKEIRSLDKDMRNWKIYLQLESMIKNMLTALKAVAELQNPAIRDRHWQQLMTATKVSYSY